VISVAIANVGSSVIIILATRQLFDLNEGLVRARLRTIACDECTQPIRWWNRRVWMTEPERCAHLQCWKGQSFLKAYVQLMSEERRHALETPAHAGDGDCADTKLRELRASARALRQQVERVEAQLRQADELAAKMRISAASRSSKQFTPSRAMSAKKD
jgi:hypothetical protein